MKKITPFLWFDTQAEQAAKFYVSIFKSSKITEISRYTEGSPGKPGSVMTVGFRLDGNPFLALNGGPNFKFNPAISFVIDCKNQKEVDHYWKKLSAGGQVQQCGWLTDKYGVSWQVVPSALGKLMSSKDKAKAQRVMQAMLQMVKLDLAGLEAAAVGKPARKRPARAKRR